MALLKNLDQRLADELNQQKKTYKSRSSIYFNGYPYCSYDKIEAQTQFSRSKIQNIIHEYLKLNKSVSRWVIHRLSEINKAEHI